MRILFFFPRKLGTYRVVQRGDGEFVVDSEPMGIRDDSGGCGARKRKRSRG